LIGRDAMNATSPAPTYTPNLPVLPSYTPDPQSPVARRRRLLVTIGLSFFLLIWGIGFAFFAPFLILFFFAPVAILAFVVIWALPMSHRAPVGALSPMLFLFMFFLVMWPNYIAIAPPGIPWITMQRLSGVPLVLALLICVSTSREFQTSVGAALRAAPLLCGVFIAFNLQEAVSIGYSISPVSSFDFFVNSEISLTAIFFTAIYVFQRPGRIERVARMLWLMAILVGVIAVIEIKYGRVPWAGHLPSFLQINDPLVDNMLKGGTRFGAYRAQSTFGNSLGLAEFESIVMPFVIHFLGGKFRLLTRWAAALSIPFMLLVVVLTGARLGLVGCFASIVLTGIAWAGPKWAKDRNSMFAPLVLLGTAAFLAVSAASVYLVGFVHARVLGGAASASSVARDTQTHMAIPKLLTHPFGHGIGTGATALGFYTQGGLLTIDSYYLNELMEFGFLGFALFYGVFVVTVWQCGKLVVMYRGTDREVDFLKPIGISVVTFFIIKSVFAETYSHPIMLMMVAIVVALTCRIAQETGALSALESTVRRAATHGHRRRPQAFGPDTAPGRP
jgi:O-Antigen ligase